MCDSMSSLKTFESRDPEEFSITYGRQTPYMEGSSSSVSR